jgi:3-hydroxyisobutyrate dehydrogenase
VEQRRLGSGSSPAGGAGAAHYRFSMLTRGPAAIVDGMANDPATTAVPEVAVLGTGLMGSGIATSLLRHGHSVRVWNRTRAKAQALTPLGAQVCASPAEAAAGADVLVTMLLDPPSVLAAVTGPAGALDRLRPGAVWLQTGTMGTEVDELQTVAGRHGVAFYDTPVVGTPEMAGAGQLGMLAAGPEAGRSRVESVARAYASRILWVGTGTEGSRLKLAVNSWILAVTLAMAEALALTEALGLDPTHFLDAIEGSPLGAEYARRKGTAVLAGDLAPTF